MSTQTKSFEVICAPFITALLKRSGEAKSDITLVHFCDLLHCVSALPDRRLCDKLRLCISNMLDKDIEFMQILKEK